MSFKEKKYSIKRNVISKEMAAFFYDYLSLKRKAAKTMFKHKFLSPYTDYFGVWNDRQVPETYSHYADIVMETLLENLTPLMQEETGMSLLPTYSYCRIYKQGDILKRHKDRIACSVSTTMNLGGDLWPIYLEPSGKRGHAGIKIELEPGDMLLYSGCDLEHWREPLEGTHNAQVFLHYNEKSSPDAKIQKFDRRPHLGLPSWFKGFKG